MPRDMMFLVSLSHFKEKKLILVHLLLYAYGSAATSNTSFRRSSVKYDVISSNANQSSDTVSYRKTYNNSELKSPRLQNERVNSMSELNFKTPKPGPNFLGNRHINSESVGHQKLRTNSESVGQKLRKNSESAGYQKLRLYPPIGTLGTYGNEWFPDEYKNNHRNLDK